MRFWRRCASRLRTPSARTSISAHLRRLRIEKACGLLRREYLSLADVALQLGFADQSHFTRSFRRVTGTTPSAFARSCRR